MIVKDYVNKYVDPSSEEDFMDILNRYSSNDPHTYDSDIDIDELDWCNNEVKRIHNLYKESKKIKEALQDDELSDLIDDLRIVLDDLDTENSDSDSDVLNEICKSLSRCIKMLMDYGFSRVEKIVESLDSITDSLNSLGFDYYAEKIWDIIAPLRQNNFKESKKSNRKSSRFYGKVSESKENYNKPKRKFQESSSPYPDFYIACDIDDENTGYEGLGIWNRSTGELVVPLPEEVAEDEEDDMRLYRGCRRIHTIAGDPDLTADLYEIFNQPRSRIYNNGLAIWYKPLNGGRIFPNIVMAKCGGPQESISYSNLPKNVADSIRVIASNHILGFGLSGDESYEGVAFWNGNIPELPLEDSWVAVTDNSVTIKAGNKEVAQAVADYLGVDNAQDIYRSGLTFITPLNDGTPNIVDAFYAKKSNIKRFTEDYEDYEEQDKVKETKKMNKKVLGRVSIREAKKLKESAEFGDLSDYQKDIIYDMAKVDFESEIIQSRDEVLSWFESGEEEDIPIDLAEDATDYYFEVLEEF